MGGSDFAQEISMTKTVAETEGEQFAETEGEQFAETEGEQFPSQFPSRQEYAQELVETVKELEKWIYGIHPFDIFQPKGREFLKDNFEAEWKHFLDNSSSDEILEYFSNIMLGQYDKVDLSLLPSLSDIVHKCSALKLPYSESRNIQKDSFKETTKMGMNVKKAHEVKTLVAFINELGSRYPEIDTIVDFGSGLGYLSHELAKSFNVVAIECDENRTDAAIKRSRNRAKWEGHHNNNLAESKKISFVTERLTVDNSCQIFEKVTSNTVENNSNMLLTGLHACGDLSAGTMIDVFLNTPRIRSIVSIGCCYHLMDPSHFPKSQYLNSLGIELARPALKLACHTFSAFDQARIIGFWKQQTLRAITQIFGSFKFSSEDDLEFSLQKLVGEYNLDIKVDRSEIFECLKNIALLSVLRCLLGPLIEALVLLDRVFVLEQTGGETRLVALFNPMISPRHHAVVCIKK